MDTNKSSDNYETLKFKFKCMLKGSKSAKHLSVLYTATSFALAFKFRTALEISIPLIISGLLVLWFTVTHLWLRGIKNEFETYSELVDTVSEYKTQTLKREKYEQYVFVFWLLTLVPVYLDGKIISSFLVMKLLLMFYIVINIGNGLFNKVKDDLEEMDHLIKNTL